jgi:maltose O-acetyltransferase
MLAGELYDAADPELLLGRQRCRALLRELNGSDDADTALRTKLFARLFGAAGAGLWIEPPFFCDYGTNITFGEHVFLNFNCVILDPAPVAIGDYVLFGPNVQLYTATHPLAGPRVRFAHHHRR